MSRLAVAAVALTAGGCELMFPLDGANTDAASDGAKVPCAPGELAVIAGAWESGAVDDQGVAYVGYRDAATGRLFVQAIDPGGAPTGIPRALTDDPSNGSELRLFAQRDLASLSLHLDLDGFSAVVVHTVTPSMLSTRSRLTFPGNQASRAVSLVHGDSALAAYRNEITTPRTFNANVEALDSATLASTRRSAYPLDGFGNPQQIIATTTGYLIHTLGDTGTRELIPVTSDGGSMMGMPVSIGGADLVTLVESTPDNQPMLGRAAAGAIELVPMALDGSLQQAQLVTSGRGQISALAARSTEHGTLALWQATEVELARITTGVTTMPIEITGSAIVARMVAEGSAGPIVYAERDAPEGAREIVAVQICEP